MRHLGPHAASLTSEDAATTRRELGWENVTLASGAKAMLMSNSKNADEPFVLAVMAANERLDWKKMKRIFPKGKNARMATEEEVWRVTGCKPGAVPPFGSVFAAPDGGSVPTFVDTSLQRQGPVINFNCGLRTRSIQIAIGDYLAVEKPELCDFVV